MALCCLSPGVARKTGIRWIARTRPVLEAVLLAAALAQSPASHAETSGLPTDSRELVVGTKSAPPFSMKGEDGAWRGISIDLWKRIAEQMHLRYRFQETTLEGLTDGVADGSLDFAWRR